MRGHSSATEWVLNVFDPNDRLRSKLTEYFYTIFPTPYQQLPMEEKKILIEHFYNLGIKRAIEEYTEKYGFMPDFKKFTELYINDEFNERGHDALKLFFRGHFNITEVPYDKIYDADVIYVLIALNRGFRDFNLEKIELYNMLNVFRTRTRGEKYNMRREVVEDIIEYIRQEKENGLRDIHWGKIFDSYNENYVKYHPEVLNATTSTSEKIIADFSNLSSFTKTTLSDIYTFSLKAINFFFENINFFIGFSALFCLILFGLILFIHRRYKVDENIKDK